MRGPSLIVGGEGQDGRLLYEHLRKSGRDVIALGRKSIHAEPAVSGARPVDIQDAAAVRSLLEAVRPAEIYFLAAYHHSSQDAMPAPAELLRSSLAIHVDALVNFLEAIRTSSSASRLFYASTSHVFAAMNTLRQDENTPLAPFGAYGLSKAAGMHCCRWYRDAFGVFVAAGILYNHESPLRRPNFVSQKIIRGAVAAKRGSKDKLILGDLSVRIDWGYAGDFVDAMARILSLGRAEDFIIATGEAHSVQEFAAAAYGAVGLDWRDHVEERRAILTKSSPGGMLVGDTTRLRNATGWKPTVTFVQMVHDLVRAAMEEQPVAHAELEGAEHPKQ